MQRFTRQTLARFCSLSLLVGSAAAAGPTHQSLPYAGDQSTKRQNLDIYNPGRDANDPLKPVMIFIHGGGWAIGDKSGVQQKPELFNDAGYVFVSLNYRLSPDVVHPAHVQDVAAGIAWVHNNIAEYGGDPGRLFIMGHSAGAHLAALVAMDESRLGAHGLTLADLSGVILLDGAGYDVRAERRQVKKFGLKRVAQMYDDAFTDDPAIQADASPILHVDSDKDIPPFLIAHVADRAESRLMSTMLQVALVENGVDATRLPVEKRNHGTLNRRIGTRNDPLSDSIIQFCADLTD